MSLVSDRLGSWIAASAIAVLAALALAQPVPAGNEYTYLALLKKSVDPDFLPADWTFSSGFQEHAVFNNVFGPLVALLGVELVAWIGRLAAWLVTGRLVVAIGRRLGAPAWASVVAVALWIGVDQSLGVGAEFVFSHFEAKAVAWPLLLAGIVVALDMRPAVTALLVGLAFSFHPAVGLWGGGALLFAMLLLRPTRRETIKWLPLAGLASLPGLIPQLDALANSSLDSPNAAFVALNRIPHHVDPLSFGERGPLILVLMLLFNLAFAWRTRALWSSSLLGLMQTLLAGVVVGGLAARALDQHWFLLLMPFRVLPVVVPLLFFLTVAGELLRDSIRDKATSLWAEGALGRTVLASGLAALLAVVVLWNPAVRWSDHLGENVEAWRSEEGDFEKALRWVRANAPPTAIVVAPPWREELFMVSERSQFVSWEAVPYDRADEWRSRLALTVSDPAVWDDVGRSGPDLLGCFASVPIDHWRSLGVRFGVDLVVTTADYEDTPSFTAGIWSVYDVGLREVG